MYLLFRDILIFRHERSAAREPVDGSCNNIFGEFKDELLKLNIQIAY
jgi:hypothetical protein